MKICLLAFIFVFVAAPKHGEVLQKDSHSSFSVGELVVTHRWNLDIGPEEQKRLSRLVVTEQELNSKWTQLSKQLEMQDKIEMKEPAEDYLPTDSEVEPLDATSSTYKKITQCEEERERILNEISQLTRRTLKTEKRQGRVVSTQQIGNVLAKDYELITTFNYTDLPHIINSGRSIAYSQKTKTTFIQLLNGASINAKHFKCAHKVMINCDFQCFCDNDNPEDYLYYLDGLCTHGLNTKGYIDPQRECKEVRHLRIGNTKIIVYTHNGQYIAVREDSMEALPVDSSKTIQIDGKYYELIKKSHNRFVWCKTRLKDKPSGSSRLFALPTRQQTWREYFMKLIANFLELLWLR
jgi:hypothetical protein